MGIWTGIKHTLNSTLGTADFQPLDKIIKSQRTYGPSDDVLVTLASGARIALSTTETKIPNIKFTPLVSGTLKVTADFTITATSGKTNTAFLEIYKNGEKYLSGSAGLSVSGTGSTTTSTKTISINCPIEKDATYEFYFYKSGGSAAIFNNLELCGRIVDLSMLEYMTY